MHIELSSYKSLHWRWRPVLDIAPTLLTVDVFIGSLNAFYTCTSMRPFLRQGLPLINSGADFCAASTTLLKFTE